MKCKGKGCEKLSGHTGKCGPIVFAEVPGWRRNQPVTTERNQPVTIVAPCNHCVTKDAEIERLRNQLANALLRVDQWAKTAVEIGRNERKKAKRDRAQYMKDYRKKPTGIAYGRANNDA